MGTASFLSKKTTQKRFYFQFLRVLLAIDKIKTILLKLVKLSNSIPKECFIFRMTKLSKLSLINIYEMIVYFLLLVNVYSSVIFFL